MQLIKRAWSAGLGGKLAVGCGGLLVAFCGCSAIALIIPTRSQQRAEATVVAAAATVETAVTASAATATTAPTPMLTPTPATAPTAEPTAAPSPTAEPPAPTVAPAAMSAEDKQKALYLIQILPITDDISDGIKGISELSLEASRDPALLVNANWKIKMAAQMAVLKLSAERLRELPDPPAGLERIGDKTRAIATELDLIVSNLGTGIDNLDAGKITAATEAMERAGVLGQEMAELVESQ